MRDLSVHLGGQNKKVTVSKLGRRIFPESHQNLTIAGVLILDFQSLELWEINICCLSHPFCHFMAA